MFRQTTSPLFVIAILALMSGFSQKSDAAMPKVLRMTDTTSVDLIELNHCYRFDRHTGKVALAYTQVIFWADRLEPTPDAGLMVKLRVVEYRVIEDDKAIDVTRGDSPTATWTENGRRRQVTARLYTESWTLVEDDPELRDNVANPRQHRLALFPKRPRRYLAPRPHLAMNAQ